MLILLVPLLAVLTAPSPVPADAAPPSPLKEIGRVQSLSVCSAVVVHANSAIGAVLDNDTQLALAVNRLRTTDLDTSNEIARRNGMNDLMTIAGRIRSGAAGGTSEVRRLRDMLASTTDPQRKAELKAFADALAGALARQRKIGQELDRMMVVIDGRRAVEDVNTADMTGTRAAIAAPGEVSPGMLAASDGMLHTDAARPDHAPVDEFLRATADDFSAREQLILADEGVAADHSLGATTGC